MELKDNERLVHTFKYGKKEIPVYYNVDKIRDRLVECSEVIRNFKSKMSNIVFTKGENDLLLADESVSTSYIEGYETYLLPEYVVNRKFSNCLADRAVKSGYDAYQYLFGNKSVSDFNADELLSTWKVLVEYKTFFIKSYRMVGVRVGNRFRTSHVAPPAKYVRTLIDDMFYTLKNYKTESEDIFNLLNSILFHYIFTFIHPFLDGNGRSARLIQEYMISKSMGVDFCLPLSSMILRDKKEYYIAFKKGKECGSNHLDVISIDITDFINYNLYIIELAVLFVLNEKKRDIGKVEKDTFVLKSFSDEFNSVNRDTVISEIGLNKFVEYLVNFDLMYENPETLFIGYLGVEGYEEDCRLLCKVGDLNENSSK